MKTVKLITCNDAMKAHILQGALENEGIESMFCIMKIHLPCCVDIPVK